MGMKTSAVWADGTFESNTAPLMGPLEDCARRAAELGYDALSLTVNRPGELDAAYVRRVLGEYGLTASGLATGRIYKMCIRDRTSYVTVARGEVPPRHWRRLSRMLLGDNDYSGMASWTGTMFEYFMPKDVYKSQDRA